MPCESLASSLLVSMTVGVHDGPARITTPGASLALDGLQLEEEVGRGTLTGRATQGRRLWHSHWCLCTPFDALPCFQGLAACRTTILRPPRSSACQLLVCSKMAQLCIHWFCWLVPIYLDSSTGSHSLCNMMTSSSFPWPASRRTPAMW